MITSEKELQDELVIHLTEQGFNCQQYVPSSVGIADVVIDNAVIELKHLPDREALFKAVGQAVLYRGAIDKNLDAKIICSYYDELSFLRLQSAGIALKQVGLELIPWMPGDALVFQTDYFAQPKNDFEEGDVCFVFSLCQQQLIKYNSCWAIVTDSIGHLCHVQPLGVEIVLPAHHLRKIDLGEKDRAEFVAVSDRILALACLMELDDIDRAQIEVMQRRTIWTERQKQALTYLEKLYGIG